MTRAWVMLLIGLIGCSENGSAPSGGSAAGRGGTGGSSGAGGTSGAAGTGGTGGASGSGGISGSTGASGSGGDAGGSGGTSGTAGVSGTGGTSGSGGAPDPTAPDWAAGLMPGTWKEIGKNSIASVDPADDPAANPNHPNSPPWNGNTGQQCVTICWCGGAFAAGFGAKGSLIAWCGGHNDYFGNEVYAFDMATELWSRLTNPHTPITFPATDGMWPDGTPSVPHTYGMVGYHPGTNSFASVQTEINNNGGNVAAVPVFFDFATKRWRRGPRAPQPVLYGGWAAYDSSRDAWWAEGGATGGRFGKYVMGGDGSAGTWTMYDAKFSALDSMATRDPVRDVLVMTIFRGQTNMYGLDLTAPESDPVLLMQGGQPPARQGAHGWEWSERRQGFVYWRSGGDVYEVKLAGTDWRTGSWNWTKLTAASNSVVPSQPTNGVYNRFRLARYGNTEIAVVVNDVAGRVYAFGLP
jgi:hypothetical protein